jgi:hypothetical protein
MSEHYLYRATISPVPDGVPRPLWSVMIPTYNCANYLRETLASVLAQDPGPEVMQIEVVDDHSTEDDPEAVVKDLGGQRVGFYRQAENVGHVRNFNTCLQRSRGRLIHLLHGDDCVRDGFYSKMQRAFDENPETGAAFCRHIYMEPHGHWLHISRLEQLESGILSNWLEKITSGHILEMPSIVVRRDVYERLGGFDRRISCFGEDWEMWVRIAAHYPVWFEVEPLALYRTNRRGSLSERAVHTGADIRDLRLVVDIIQSYLSMHLPKTTARELIKKTRQRHAFYATENAHDMLNSDDTAAAVAQMREALRCSHSLTIFRQVFLLGLRIGVRSLRQKAPIAALWRKRKAAI